MLTCPGFRRKRFPSPFRPFSWVDSSNAPPQPRAFDTGFKDIRDTCSLEPGVHIADESPRLGPDAPGVGTVSAEYQRKYFPSSHRGWNLGKEAFRSHAWGMPLSNKMYVLGSPFTFRFILFPILTRFFIRLYHSVGILVRHLQSLLEPSEVEITK